VSQPSCQEISAAVAASAEQARAWLMQMISYPSTQGHEAECQAYIKQLFEQVGSPAEYREIPDELVDDPEYSHSENEQPYAGRCDLVAQRAGSGQSRSVILQTHGDGGEDPLGRGGAGCPGTGAKYSKLVRPGVN